MIPINFSSLSEVPVGCQVTTRMWLSFFLIRQRQPRVDWTLISAFYRWVHGNLTQLRSQELEKFQRYLFYLLFIIIFFNFLSTPIYKFCSCLCCSFLCLFSGLEHAPKAISSNPQHSREAPLTRHWGAAEELPLQTSLFACWGFFSKTFEGLAEDAALKNRTPAPFAAVLVLPSLCWTAEVLPRSHTKLP